MHNLVQYCQNVLPWDPGLFDIFPRFCSVQLLACNVVEELIIDLVVCMQFLQNIGGGIPKNFSSGLKSFFIWSKAFETRQFSCHDGFIVFVV